MCHRDCQRQAFRGQGSGFGPGTQKGPFYLSFTRDLCSQLAGSTQVQRPPDQDPYSCSLALKCSSSIFLLASCLALPKCLNKTEKELISSAPKMRQRRRERVHLPLPQLPGARPWVGSGRPRCPCCPAGEPAAPRPALPCPQASPRQCGVPHITRCCFSISSFIPGEKCLSLSSWNKQGHRLPWAISPLGAHLFSVKFRGWRAPL